MDFGVASLNTFATSTHVNNLMGWGVWNYIFGIVIVALLLPDLFSVFRPILNYFQHRNDHTNTLGNFITVNGRSKWMSDDNFGEFAMRNELHQIGSQMRVESYVRVDDDGVQEMRVEREMYDIVKGRRK